MRHSRILSWTMTFILIFMVAPIAFAFNFTTIDTPGAIDTYPMGINDRGQIVGYYFDDSDNEHGFLAAP